mmetsp:Transcript_21649/g.61600  ORF Transcript_21649/g.61600 Transcript_21649/m.61600 type:complete len:253 (-) Transcript_21649:50-808(-)
MRQTPQRSRAMLLTAGCLHVYLQQVDCSNRPPLGQHRHQRHQEEDECRVDGDEDAVGGVLAMHTGQILGQRGIHMAKDHPHADKKRHQSHKPPEAALPDHFPEYAPRRRSLGLECDDRFVVVDDVDLPHEKGHTQVGKGRQCADEKEHSVVGQVCVENVWHMDCQAFLERLAHQIGTDACQASRDVHDNIVDAVRESPSPVGGIPPDAQREHGNAEGSTQRQTNQQDSNSHANRIDETQKTSAGCEHGHADE